MVTYSRAQGNYWNVDKCTVSALILVIFEGAGHTRRERQSDNKCTMYVVCFYNNKKCLSVYYGSLFLLSLNYLSGWDNYLDLHYPISWLGEIIKSTAEIHVSSKRSFWRNSYSARSRNLFCLLPFNYTIWHEFANYCHQLNSGEIAMKRNHMLSGTSLKLRNSLC